MQKDNIVYACCLMAVTLIATIAVGGPIPDDVAFHFDASKTNTMTIVSENGTNFVARWDCVSGSGYATAREEDRRPFLGTFNGRTIVDFGTYNNDPYGCKTGYGASMAWSETDTSIREVFLVYSDVYGDEPYDAPGGPFFLGSCGDLGTYHFHRNGLKLIDKNASSVVRSGVIQVDGLVRTVDFELPAGFHLIHLRPTGNVSANAFATDRNTRKGGQRLAEVVVFNRTLTTEETSGIETMLIKKWFGTGRLIDFGSRFHFDASDTGTMTTVGENGTNFVTRWNSVSGSGYATARDEDRRPFLGTFNGRTIIDFGTYNNDPYDHPNGYGASMAWSETDTSIREVFLVYSDVYGDEPYDLPGGPFFLGSCGDLDTYHFHRNGLKLFYNASQVLAKNGVIQIDGCDQTISYALPAGFHLIHLRPTASVSANAFATDRNTRKGGQRLAEVLVFDAALSDDRVKVISERLYKKWFCRKQGLVLLLK